MGQEKWRYQEQSKNESADNFLKTVKFEHPTWIPAIIALMPATWKRYGQDLEKIILDHPRIFPDYQKGINDFGRVTTDQPTYRKGRFTDSFGCVWENTAEGLAGLVVEYPLEDWRGFESYRLPHPLTQGEQGISPDWDKIKRDFDVAKREGRLAWGGVPHGFFYMRLYYLRGFENLMLDIAAEEPRLRKLEEMLLEYNIELVNKYLDLGVEIMSIGEDLGNQAALPMSPAHFRQYIKPYYRKIFRACKEAGVLVYEHSDGHILEIIDDLIECGVDILNPQIRANTLKGLTEFRGKVCISLDLDRQLFPFATPVQIRDHIKEAIDTLYLPQGGLMISAECEPDVPLANIEAICDTLEEYTGPWA